MTTSPHLSRTALFAGVVAGSLCVTLAAPLAASAHPGAGDRHRPAIQGQTQGGQTQGDPAQSGTMPKVPVMTGSGGAVASVDRDASQAGLDVLARGGNAADAAVATAAALGVTEPYSAGIGGGGFLVYYDARHHTVRTIDGRETAPTSFTDKTFTNPDGSAMDFNTVVNSGLSIGVPGTPALWDKAARDFGTRSFADLMAPAEALASKGFVVDQTFHDQTAQNAARFSRFPETARVFLRDGQAPAVGSTFTNPDMAKAYA